MHGKTTLHNITTHKNLYINYTAEYNSVLQLPRIYYGLCAALAQKGLAVHENPASIRGGNGFPNVMCIVWQSEFAKRATQQQNVKEKANI